MFFVLFLFLRFQERKNLVRIGYRATKDHVFATKNPWFPNHRLRKWIWYIKNNRETYLMFCLTIWKSKGCSSNLFMLVWINTMFLSQEWTLWWTIGHEAVCLITSFKVPMLPILVENVNLKHKIHKNIKSPEKRSCSAYPDETVMMLN